MRMAYYFDYDYDSQIDPTGYAEEVVKYLEEWKRNPETGLAVLPPSAGRPVDPVRHSLGGERPGANPVRTGASSI
jgi:hypothetical protein